MQVVVPFANTADLSAKFGYAVKYSGGVAAVCSAITDQAIGVITKGGDATLAKSDVCIFGECSALAGGTITRGQFLTPKAADSSVVATAASGCTEFAIALEDAVAGDLFNIFVLGGHKQWA